MATAADQSYKKERTERRNEKIANRCPQMKFIASSHFEGSFFRTARMAMSSLANFEIFLCLPITSLPHAAVKSRQEGAALMRVKKKATGSREERPPLCVCSASNKKKKKRKRHRSIFECAGLSSVLQGGADCPVKCRRCRPPLVTVGWAQQLRHNSAKANTALPVFPVAFWLLGIFVLCRCVCF